MSAFSFYASGIIKRLDELITYLSLLALLTNWCSSVGSCGVGGLMMGVSVFNTNYQIYNKKIKFFKDLRY